MLQRSPIAQADMAPVGADGNRPYLCDDAVAGLIEHPRFDAAMLAVTAATVELYRGHWALDRLVNDRGRCILGLMVLDLHFVLGNGTGFTTAQLMAAAVAHGVCSRGHSTAFIASLRLRGFLQPIAAEDRRVRRLAPTVRFIAVHRERWNVPLRGTRIVARRR